MEGKKKVRFVKGGHPADLELITGFEPHKCNNYKMKTTISEIFSFVSVFAFQGNTFSISVFIQIYLTFCFCLLRKVIWIFVFLWQVLTIFIFKSSLKILDTLCFLSPSLSLFSAINGTQTSLFQDMR